VLKSATAARPGEKLGLEGRRIFTCWRELEGKPGVRLEREPNSAFAGRVAFHANDVQLDGAARERA